MTERTPIETPFVLLFALCPFLHGSIVLSLPYENLEFGRSFIRAGPLAAGAIQNSRFQIQDSPAGDLYESFGLNRSV